MASLGICFLGRFKAILFDRDAYFLEVCRYVELNPVRAGIVTHPEEWWWSSYRCNAGDQQPPEWMDTSMVHGHLVGSAIETAAQRKQAARAYERLVASSHDSALWVPGLKQQIYLGDDAFVTRMQAMAQEDRLHTAEIPKCQRHPTRRNFARRRNVQRVRHGRLHDDLHRGSSRVVGIPSKSLDCTS